MTEYTCSTHELANVVVQPRPHDDILNNVAFPMHGRAQSRSACRARAPFTLCRNCSGLKDPKGRLGRPCALLRLRSALGSSTWPSPAFARLRQRSMMPRTIERDNATKPASCLHDALQHPVNLSMRTAESDECPLSTTASADQASSRTTSVSMLANRTRPETATRLKVTTRPTGLPSLSSRR